MPKLRDIPPRELNANLDFRIRMIEWGRKNKDNARALWTASRRDPVFYCNTFVYTFSPKDYPEEPVRPFILWDYQEKALDEMVKVAGQNDMLIEKARDMGASWLAILLIEWYWHFYDLRPMLLFSRNQDLVEKTDDPDCLFWKFDFIHKWQPAWIKPPGLGGPPYRSIMHRYNRDTGSVVDGGSTTEDVSRGGRRFIIMLDEFASVQQGYEILAASGDATNCRIFNSTPKGPQGAFYDLRQNKHIKKILFHWKDHPLKNVGLYKYVKGTVEYIDSEYWTDERIREYNFVLDGKLRSVPYDEREKRTANPFEMAQEWDIDYVGSAPMGFPVDLIERLIETQCHPPFLQGNLVFDPHNLRVTDFVEDANGQWRLWIYFNAQMEMPNMHSFVLGCDISQGTGSSHSCISVLQLTGAGSNRRAERIAEFTSNITATHEFAKMAAVAGYWFSGPNDSPALLNWEVNGPGKAFGKEITHNLKYPNLWYRRDPTTMTTRPSPDRLGWASTVATRSDALWQYRTGLESGAFVPHCVEALEECLEWRLDNQKRFVHWEAGKSAAQAVLSGHTAHSDRVLADAVAFVACDATAADEPKPDTKPQYGSFQWRREARKHAMEARQMKKRKLHRIRRR